MWGYIGLSLLQLQTNKVPSLYVRVYLFRFSLFLYFFRSLIICEGISHLIVKRMVLELFPHYMWGYIDTRNGWGIWTHVPSLYVRVYRRAGSSRTKQSSSLIICEGISTRFFFCEMMRRFPHYMWGYIAISGILFLQSSVPSLYVRVYHWHHIVLPHCVCSLIICEGISFWGRRTRLLWKFPHYMWGYITSGQV